VNVLVGQTRITRDIEHYAQKFQLVELRTEAARLPALKKLKTWARNAPEGFAFCLALPTAAFEPSTADSALEYALGIAEVLTPAWWVLRTPASVRPTSQSKRHLANLIARLGGSVRVAWEPGGVWDDAGALRAAKELGVHLVRDGSRQELPEADVVYTRLRALGEGASVGLGAAEHLAEQLVGRAEAYVVVEGMGAGRVRDVLAAELESEEDD
jgi:uncharacterized protein YecE (DUF72 family)